MSCRLFTHIYVYMLTMYTQQPQQHKERGKMGGGGRADRVCQ